VREITHVEPDETLNAVVARYANALPVLTRHGLDTCCGGAHTLREAARLHGLDLGELLAELNAAAAAHG